MGKDVVSVLEVFIGDPGPRVNHRHVVLPGNGVKVPGHGGQGFGGIPAPKCAGFRTEQQHRLNVLAAAQFEQRARRLISRGTDGQLLEGRKVLAAHEAGPALLFLAVNPVLQVGAAQRAHAPGTICLSQDPGEAMTAQELQLVPVPRHQPVQQVLPVQPPGVHVMLQQRNVERSHAGGERVETLAAQERRHNLQHEPVRADALVQQPLEFHEVHQRAGRPARKVKRQDRLAGRGSQRRQLFRAEAHQGPGAADHKQQRPVRILRDPGRQQVQAMGILRVVAQAAERQLHGHVARQGPGQGPPGRIDRFAHR
jgi:hypothetical protein